MMNEDLIVTGNTHLQCLRSSNASTQSGPSKNSLNFQNCVHKHHTILKGCSQIYCIQCGERYIEAALEGNISIAKPAIFTLNSIFQEFKEAGVATFSPILI